MSAKKPFKSISAPAPAKPSVKDVAQFAAERAPSLATSIAERPATEIGPAPAEQGGADEKPKPKLARLNLEIPASLRPQIRQRALDEDCTIVAVVLRALAKDGFDIAEEDLQPYRRHG